VHPAQQLIDVDCECGPDYSGNYHFILIYAIIEEIGVSGIGNPSLLYLGGYSQPYLWEGDLCRVNGVVYGHK
jgi:hypothetical protein